MTTNQLAYLRAVEEQRHNREMEGLQRQQIDVSSRQAATAEEQAITSRMQAQTAADRRLDELRQIAVSERLADSKIESEELNRLLAKVEKGDLNALREYIDNEDLTMLDEIYMSILQGLSNAGNAVGSAFGNHGALRKITG